MNRVIIFVAVAVIAGCVSCTKWCMFPIRGNGDLVTSDWTVGAFDGVSAAGSVEVRFFECDVHRVVVTVDDNLYGFVKIDVKNDVLRIGTKSGNFSFTKYRVDVYAPTLSSVTISGSGSFKTDDVISASSFSTVISGSGRIEAAVECNSFSATISGSGRTTISGASNSAKINISGSGRFDGSDFSIKDADVRISGSGNANVWVTDNLSATISGSGDVRYKGDPKVTSNVSGSGRIRKM